jgi:ribulose-phosphate 3-epimerase
MPRPAPAGPVVLPSVLSANFTQLGEEARTVEASPALHIDVMDGHFVTQLSFGPLVVKALRAARAEAYLDCHLMVTNPEDLARPLAEAGADLLTFHAELADNVRRTLGDLRAAVAETGCHVGVAINPATPAEAVYPILDAVDLVLVMSVVPGRSGQSFMPEVLPKVEAIRERLGPGQHLQMDGGIGPDTIRQCRDAGCDWFVAASAIFGQADRAAALATLQEAVA